jgi:type II secretory pathway predicted ATPase ExeA
MYTAYFGFHSKPFKPKDPKDFYRNTNFDAACADILDGIRERRGFALLTGEAGVGKSLTLRRCMAEADDIRFIQLVNAHLDFPDILNYLCANLELPVTGLDTEQQKRLLLDALAAQARRNRAVALFIDDAQHLPTNVLLGLQELVEAPAIPIQRLQIVLAGLPEMAGKLDQPELRRLRGSIRVRCHLERLSGLETGLFIDHQLKVAGYTGSGLLSPAAVERIDAYCKGVPRSIAILCDTVLLLASLQSERDITPTLVDEAAQSCFLGDQSRLIVDTRGAQRGLSPPETLPTVAAESADFDLDLSEFDFSFDFGEQTMRAKSPAPAKPVPASTLKSTLVPPSFSAAAPHTPPATEQAFDVLSARMEQAGGLDDTVSLLASPEPAEVSPPPSSSPLGGFAQLLDEIAEKLDRGDTRNREALRYFLDRYLRLLQGGEPARLSEFEQRVKRLTETQQPVFVGLATAVKSSPGQDGVLCALLINPTWWLYREIRLRLRSADLVFANDGQIPPLRLLDGRDAQLVFLNYRYPRTGLAQTTLWLELDLCDHRGDWRAYDSSRREIRLDLAGRSGGGWGGGTTAAVGQHERFWPEPLAARNPPAGTWLLAEPSSMRNLAGIGGHDAGDLVCTFPLELEADPARTNSLRSATEHALSRGTPLTRALLLAADPAQAPARIELVSRPFMIFGRHSATAGTGFGDFSLGFVPKYTRVSRLHCVVCALGDQLALMPASDQGYTYTGRNGRRLERGRWELLETDDTLEICDLYRLKLALAWDRKWERGPAPNWDPQRPREKFGHYLLELVDVLHKRDQQAGADELRTALRNRYLNLLRIQDRVAQLNGVGNPGALLYARFEREDAARQQIAHFYIPKWLSLGSSPQAGLRIDAEGVAPNHAELLFRDGMYWIQNLAGPGAIRIGQHGLATNEVLALEVGDVLMIGAAQFTFEAY